MTRGSALEDWTHHGGFPHERLFRRVLSPLVWAATVFLIPGCGSDEPAAPVAAGSGAVSSAAPEATGVGIRILALGGNAVDAAVAASLTLGVVEPSESGLGGNVVMLVTRPGDDPVVIHATPEVITSAGPTTASFLRPSMVSVLVHAWREYGSGRLSWEQVVAPRAAAGRERLLPRALSAPHDGEGISSSPGRLRGGGALAQLRSFDTGRGHAGSISRVGHHVGAVGRGGPR